MIHLDSLLAQIFGALLIGEEIFVIAALWPLAEWAAARPRGKWLATSLVLTLGCMALYAHALRRLAAPETVDRTRADSLVAMLAFPFFIAFPDAICVASAQSLRLAGAPAHVARAVSLAVAALGVVVAPLAAKGVGCALAGLCS